MKSTFWEKLEGDLERESKGLLRRKIRPFLERERGAEEVFITRWWCRCRCS